MWLAAALLAPVAIQYAGPAPYLVAGASQINFTAVNAPLYLAGGSAGLVRLFSIYVAP